MELIKRAELRRPERIRRAIALLREARKVMLEGEDRLNEQRRAAKRIETAIEQAENALRQAINDKRKKP